MQLHSQFYLAAASILIIFWTAKTEGQGHVQEVTMPPFVLSKVLESKLKCGHLFRALPSLGRGAEPTTVATAGLPQPTTTNVPTTTTTGDPFLTDPLKWRNTIYAAINGYRAEHGAPALVHSDELRQIANDAIDMNQHKNKTSDPALFTKMSKMGKVESGMGFSSVDDIWKSATTVPASNYKRFTDNYNYATPGFNQGKNLFAFPGIIMLWKSAAKIACEHGTRPTYLHIICLFEGAPSYAELKGMSTDNSIKLMRENILKKEDA